jgi:hypothetical protein
LIEIQPSDPAATAPYATLVPIAEALIAHGNAPLFPELFRLTRDGWSCELRDPIDFDLVEKEFSLPRSIRCSREHDGILDEMTWSAIGGPGGRGPWFVYPSAT